MTVSLLCASRGYINGRESKNYYMRLEISPRKTSSRALPSLKVDYKSQENRSTVSYAPSCMRAYRNLGRQLSQESRIAGVGGVQRKPLLCPILP